MNLLREAKEQFQVLERLVESKMLEELKQRVNLILKRDLDKKKIIKYSAISKILEDKFCFFKMSLDESLNILKDLE